MRRVFAYIMFFFLTGGVFGQHYRIGDLYTAPDGSQGIIFYLYPDGSGGWVVALQDIPGEYKWGYDNISTPGLPHFSYFYSGDGSTILDAYRLVTDDTAGYSNTQIIRTFFSSQEPQEPLAATIVDFENGWYLPAIGQLNILLGNLVEVNAGLAAVGGTLFDMDYYANSWWLYWSSTEYSQFDVWELKCRGDVGHTGKYFDGGEEFPIGVRSVSAF